MSNQKQIAVAGTAEEWQVLVNLINVAVKATGLDGAKAGVVWSERIAKAVNDANTQHTKQNTDLTFHGAGPLPDTSPTKANG